MQQRFCTCGYAVWVQYLFSRAKCKTIFWSGNADRGYRLTICPCCGRRLNIDELY